MNYRPRIADEIIKEKLESSPAILIEGTKWSGKTTTGAHLAKSIVYMDREDKQKNMLLSRINPLKLLEGETPHMIDEWQLSPNLWDIVRCKCDTRGRTNQFILTGSSVPQISKETNPITHSGVGRIARFKMRPMSLFESGDSSGTVSLSDLFEAEEIFSECSTSIEDICFYISRGGWPFSIDKEKNTALKTVRNFVEEIINSESFLRRGSVKAFEAEAVLNAYSRHIGSDSSFDKIFKDVETRMSRPTFLSYYGKLVELFIIEELPAWSPNLRSKTAIRTSNVRYFVDPSIAVAVKSLTSEALLNDLNTLGFYFENMAIRDLRVYAEALGAKVYRYRDATNLECDAVIVLPDGSYGLVEIKLGGSKLEEDGVKTLLRMQKKLNALYTKSPSFLMVLEGVGQLAYKRKEDGVYIVPITTLRN